MNTIPFETRLMLFKKRAEKIDKIEKLNQFLKKELKEGGMTDLSPCENGELLEVYMEFYAKIGLVEIYGFKTLILN